MNSAIKITNGAHVTVTDNVAVGFDNLLDADNVSNLNVARNRAVTPNAIAYLPQELLNEIFSDVHRNSTGNDLVSKYGMMTLQHGVNLAAELQKYIDLGTGGIALVEALGHLFGY